MYSIYLNYGILELEGILEPKEEKPGKVKSLLRLQSIKEWSAQGGL